MNYGYGEILPLIIFLIIIGAAVYLMIKISKVKAIYGSSQDTTLNTLRKSYDKGEITKEEFDRMKRDLSE